MSTKAFFEKRRYIEIEFDCLPSAYSTIIIRKKKKITSIKDKNDGDKEEPMGYDKVSRMRLKDFMLSIGTVFARAQGSSFGYIYYNDIDMFSKGKKYSLYCIEESDGSLRIDFLPLVADLFSETNNIAPPNMDNPDVLKEAVIFAESQIAFQTAVKLPASKLLEKKPNSDFIKIDEEEFLKSIYTGSCATDPSYKVPVMVFKGDRVPFFNDRDIPFIGVVEFI